MKPLPPPLWSVPPHGFVRLRARALFPRSRQSPYMHALTLRSFAGLPPPPISFPPLFPPPPHMRPPLFYDLSIVSSPPLPPSLPSPPSPLWSGPLGGPHLHTLQWHRGYSLDLRRREEPRGHHTYPVRGGKTGVVLHLTRPSLPTTLPHTLPSPHTPHPPHTSCCMLGPLKSFT